MNWPLKPLPSFKEVVLPNMTLMCSSGHFMQFLWKKALFHKLTSHTSMGFLYRSQCFIQFLAKCFWEKTPNLTVICKAWRLVKHYFSSQIWTYHIIFLTILFCELTSPPHEGWEIANMTFSVGIWTFHSIPSNFFVLNGPLYPHPQPIRGGVAKMIFLCRSRHFI